MHSGFEAIKEKDSTAKDDIMETRLVPARS
jgi:hypothetical protein